MSDIESAHSGTAPRSGPPASDLDEVWRALGNPWRRHILDLVRDQPRTTGELAQACEGIGRFAVMQHLKVLEQARLVIPRKVGRKRFNHLNPVPIQRIHERWVRKYEGHWADALIGLKKSLEEESDTVSGSAG